MSDFGPPAPPSGPTGPTGPTGPSGPSGPSGAEQPMAEIPFSEDELGNLTNTSRAMLFAGMTTVVAAVVDILCGLASGFLMDEPAAATVTTLCVNLVAAAVAVVLGGLLIVGSRALKRVVTTDEADQTYLVAAFGKLRAVFLVKLIWIVLLVLLMCLAGVFRASVS